MKTEFQVLQFIASQRYKNKTDWEIIQLFCQKHHFRLGTAKPTLDPDLGISGDKVVDWFYNGFAAGEIAKVSDGYVNISKSDLEVSQICGKISTDGVFREASLSVTVQELAHILPEEQIELEAKLSQQGLEYNRNKAKVMKKYLPAINDRVVYHNLNETGLGVVRSIHPAENKVELYCYYSYTSRKCAYSMHEPAACTYHEFHFEPMNIVAYRRLNRELEKFGKVWYDKLHRIEPLKVKAEVGERYWYISDKMKVVQETEKGTPTSQFRYIAGNYFTSHEDALEYPGRFTELLRNRLAK